MGQIVRISVIKEDNDNEYAGNVEISTISGLTIKCSYNLINQENKDIHCKGNFETQYQGLAKIIGQLQSIVNTFSEPQCA
jgi:hypothetical protein